MAVCSNCGLESAEDFRFCPSCGTRHVTDTRTDPILGRTLGGKYRVVSQIGAGSMGTVYRAEHIALKKPIAIKILRRDLEVGEEALRRFQREGIAAGQISHPNVIQIFDFDRTDDGTVYLAMEFVDGDSLKSWLASRGKLEPEEAVELVKQLLSSLVEAHRHGIVHRDLKPENVMVTESATATRALKVLDFGLSKLVDRPMDMSQQTIPGRVLGTPMYMAPEQWKGEDVDHRTDIYAATLILYELLAGEPPFRGKDMTETMAKTTTQPPPSLLDAQLEAAVPEELDDIVQTGLAKAREERYQSASQMLIALQEVEFDGAIASTVRRTRKSKRRRTASGKSPIVPIALGAGLLAVAAGLWYFFGGGAAPTTDGLVRDRAAELRTEPEREYIGAVDDALTRLREGDPAAALGAIENALATKVEDPEVYVVRAAVHRSRGDDDLALADYAVAIENFPGYAEAKAGMGWVELGRGNVDAADEHFTGALALDADSAEGLAGQGAVHYVRGADDEAEAVLDRAAGSHATSPVVQLWRGRVKLRKGDFDGAVQSLGRAVSLDPKLWQAHDALGDAYLGKGDVESAKRQFEDAVAKSNDEPDLKRKLAEVLVAQGDFEGAAEWSRGLSGAGPKGRFHMLRGMIAQGQGKQVEAIRSFESALDFNTDQRGLLFDLLAALELQRGNHRRAVTLCESGVEEDGGRASLHTTLGLAQFELDQYADAAASLERAVELGSDAALVHYSLGVLYMDYLGDTRQALEHLESYRSLGGTDSRVDGWIRRLR